MYHDKHKHEHSPKLKKRCLVSASRLAEMLQPTPNLRNAAYLSVHKTAGPSNQTESMNVQSHMSTLPRSTRNRTNSVNLEDYETDNIDTEDADLMRRTYRPATIKVENNPSLDEQSSPMQEKRTRDTISLPRREGLRPRKSTIRHSSQDSEDQECTEEEDDRNKGEAGDEGEEDEVDEVEEEGEEGKEQEGRRRYALRNRTEARRFSLEKEENQRLQSPPRKVLHKGMGIKNARDARRGGSRAEKHRCAQRVDDSDDSLLVDEMDQGPVGSSSWMHVGNTNFGQQWVCGGLDMHNATAWGLKVAASGWGHQGDTFGYGGVGAQPAEPSSKGGADIQPLQVDETVSFDDIGGLSDHIDALKEMVFFPLLYPDFFANYHISPPRGVLLCGPPGTGKTLIARALACAASKAGQKVNFYMRKGADVLSKWVGEAERQLKLLFLEAQRNQPSIIFFDEIDGLAPVRSSKQEQIHNSIVSTLLALMDGLDSRGQVVLIGATNRIDAIDGALRRPGRFDREFVFSLPDCKARAEILKIHTRKWKNPLSEEIRMELAAACMGYCGADLKALCTEAAINAFREKYPQIYTSDDKFVIDLDSVKVEKHDFLEAMSTITPAAHRGATVQSRPLSPVIAPCLQGQLKIISDYISDIFYVVAKGDKKDSLNDSSRHLAKLLGFPYGSSIPFVYRPRLLLCGKEGAGLDHIGPAVLHELERFPVHCLGLPSLLSDPSARTPEEALVHIVGEARRTTPSILYLPQLQLWWETAHDQLRAVLLSILEELPSDLPLLLLATSSVPSDELDGEAASLFGRRYIYQVEKPSSDDRCRFISQLVDAVLTIPDQQVVVTPKKNVSNPELPKVPKAARGPSETELRAKVEAEEHAIRRLRMCLRDVCSRLLYEKRFSVFHYPVMDEDAPDYYAIVQNPMDITTLLQRVDNRRYLTCSAFLQDVELIPANAKAYNGDDYNGARIVSRAYALRDAILGMLSQMDPALVAFCDKIAAQGGPTRLSEDSTTNFPSNPVAQPVHITRASECLRNVQPDMNVSQSYEVLKRSKQNSDPDQGKVVAGDSDPFAEDRSQPMEIDTPGQNTLKTKCLHGSVTNEAFKGVQQCEANNQEEIMNQPEHKSSSKVPISNHLAVQIESIEDNFVKCTEGYGISELERLYALICRRVISLADANKPTIIKFLKDFSSDESNFHR
ncbi:ATPase family AAA domain-containing protein At1g05910-like [Cryptomeria japonica]|nr:ATPase family AAA domain-containing protein At1g05910-like [Cryptomeria japonica]XP_059071307.1 ATPase family AAA domain-containing protein At1g05910-like [Cryptomeria japonica]